MAMFDVKAITEFAGTASAKIDDIEKSVEECNENLRRLAELMEERNKIENDRNDILISILETLKFRL